MTVFIDTSAFYAALDVNDRQHARSRETWTDLGAAREPLVTSSYGLLETVALIQSRLGIEAVRLFNDSFAPLVRILWVDAEVHEQGLAALLAIGRRQVSLVDCASFVLMR